MADIDYDKLSEAINKGRGSSGSGIDSGGAGDALKKFTEPLKAATKYVEDSAGAFNKLSETGNSFNNDIIGMKVAAANTRMSFDDFAGMMTKNNGEVGKSFAGLGGSVAKGGQAFTEFSKTFFDSGVAENLRQMGYTSKDLNEVLATQIGFQKSTTDTSVAGQIKTAAAAADLANEMDLIAKQTGKTRKEQEAGLEKAKADGQIEAKMRLIGLTQGADAEKEARAGFAKQLAQAQAMGTDQVFKEMFATGTVRSQEAAMQMGLLGQAARETANSAKELSKGNVEASQSAMNSAKEGNLANQSNKALLQITAAGVGPAADVMKKNIETNDAAYQGASKTAKALGLAMDDVTKVLGAQKKAIQDEQQARHGATSAMIAVQSRLQDATAAVANKVVAPLNATGSNLDTAGRKVASQLSTGVGAGDTTKKTAEQYETALRNQQQMGGKNNAPVGAREKIEATASKLGVDKAVQTVDKVAGGALQGAGATALKAANFVGDAMKVYQINKDKLETRDEGTLGKTGSAVEPADFIGKVAKGEMVLTPDQAKKFMEGAKTEGIADAVKNLGSMMPGGAKGDSGGGGISLSSLSKEISTSVSSVTSGSSTTKQVQSDDSKQAQTEMANLKKQFESDWASRKSVIIDGMAVEDRKFSKVQAAMKADDEAIKIKEDYAKKQEEIQKKIDAGITWEFEKKSEQVEETKTFVKEQADLLKVANNEMLAIQETASTEKVNIEKEVTEKLASISTGVTDKLASPTASAVPKFDKSKFAMPSMDQLTIGPDGMPKISAKPQAQTIPAAVKASEKQASPGKKINPETGEEYSPVAETKTAETKTAGIETKTATLDDVAKLLSSLNTTMKQIATAASETNNKLGQQVKATKAMSGNVHGAV
jgi:hypothetical protein